MTARYNRDVLARQDREENRLHDENEWVRTDPKAEAVAKRAEKELRGTIPLLAVRALLPTNADPLAPQDPERRASFAKRLAEIAEGSRKAVSEPRKPEPPPSGREALSVGVCTACRGSCCRSGGDHAYLTEETIAQVLTAHPDWTLPQLVETYLQHLPAESVANSCVYHSATGCGLPRTLRSETCNQHLCGKLKHLLSTLPEQNPPPVLGVLFDDGRWARTALIQDGDVRILADSGQE